MAKLTQIEERDISQFVGSHSIMMEYKLVVFRLKASHIHQTNNQLCAISAKKKCCQSEINQNAKNLSSHS